MRRSFKAMPLNCFQSFDTLDKLVTLGSIKVGGRFSIPAGELNFNVFAYLFEKDCIGEVVESPELPGPGMLSSSVVIRIAEPKKHGLRPGISYDPEGMRLPTDILVKPL